MLVPQGINLTVSIKSVNQEQDQHQEYFFHDHDLEIVKKIQNQQRLYRFLDLKTLNPTLSPTTVPSLRGIQ